MKGPHVKKKKWTLKTLGELYRFVEGFYPDGIAINDMARDLNTTPQAITNMFRRDDMKLSRAEEIVRSYGYTLNLYCPIREYTDGYVPQEPKFHYPEAGNLTGLVKYIQDSEYSLNFVAEKSGISTSVLTLAFSRGDILLSTLNKIMDNLGITMMWKYTKLTEDKVS